MATEVKEKVGTYADRVTFKVEHKKDFKKEKQHLNDGDVLELHPNHAEVLEKKGVGKIVK